MNLREKVERVLSGGPRVTEGVSQDPDADIANLRAAVRELQRVAVLLAEEIDKLSERSG